MIYLLNSFSPSMLKEGENVVHLSQIEMDEVKKIIEEQVIVSAIGHSATADIISRLLGMTVMVERVEISLGYGDQAIVFHLLKRLEEGRIIRTVKEIEEIGYKFWRITVRNPLDLYLGKGRKTHKS